MSTASFLAVVELHSRVTGIGPRPYTALGGVFADAVWAAREGIAPLQDRLEDARYAVSCNIADGLSNTFNLKDEYEISRDAGDRRIQLDNAKIQTRMNGVLRAPVNELKAQIERAQGNLDRDYSFLLAGDGGGPSGGPG